MIGWLAGGGRAVMAAETIAGNAGVIESCRRPQAGVVAALAGLAGLNMASRFARCNLVVVTTAATALHCHVINARNDIPLIAEVTHATGIGGADVIR